MAASSSEVTRLQQHLDLLRDQYVKLQQKHSDLEQKYARALAASGSVGPENFVSKLVKLVSELYNKPLFSDIQIILADHKLPGHRFVLSARSQQWDPTDERLSSTAELDLSHMTSFVAAMLIRWVYTDSVVLPHELSAVIELLGASHKYNLPQLKEKCEQSLMSSVNVRNCIKLYQASEEHGAEQLKKYCLQIISSHWNNLNTDDFAELSAPLLYDMFKAHSSFPLHLAIQHLREDVMFLFLIEYNSQLPYKLDECDDEGDIPLNLALLNRHESMASTLVSNKCNLNILNRDGDGLLHLAILRGDGFAASFLVKNGGSTTLARKSTQESPLHLAASYHPSRARASSQVASRLAPQPDADMSPVASLLLEYHANPDAQDCSGCTPLHRCVETGNREVFDVLLNHSLLNLDVRNNAGQTALWLAVKQLDPSYLSCDDISKYDETSAARLIARGSNTDSTDARTGNSLLHQAAMESDEAAAVFLVHHGAAPNSTNALGESPLHVAATRGLHRLVEVLLMYGANPNLQTNLKSVSIMMAAAMHMPMNAVPTMSPTMAGSPALSARSTNDLMEPSMFSAVQALSALEATTQLASSYAGHHSANTSPSLRSSVPTQQAANDSYSVAPLSPPGLQDHRGRGSPLMAVGGARGGAWAGTNNPFGYDSDDEVEVEEDLEPRDAVGSPQPAIGYRFSPLPHQKHNFQGPTDTSNTAATTTGHRHSLPSQSSFDSPSMPSSKAHTAAVAVSAKGERAMPSPLIRTTSFSPKGGEVTEFLRDPVSFEPSQDVGGQTALHLAIVHRHPKVVDVLLRQKNCVSSGKLHLELNISMTDGRGECPLGLALWTTQFPVARKLLDAGADVESPGSTVSGGGGGGDPGEERGETLLYMAIVRAYEEAGIFLLENGADFQSKTPSGESLLILAICHQLESLVDKMCEMGVDMKQVDSSGNTALWVALRSRQETIANKMIVHGCDPNAWNMATDRTTLTLLHRSILLHDTPTASFLIRSGADVNSPTRPPPEGQGGGAYSPPLHMACERGLLQVVKCLVEHNADVNAKDSRGRTALHVSIWYKQPRCSDVLLTHRQINLNILDKEGQTPFATALSVKDHEAGLAILKKEPKAAEQVDSKGQNFLHIAVSQEDVEAVIFLLSVHVDVNSKVQSQCLYTPLHLAIKKGSEILVRHLLLAGAHVSGVDYHQRGCLHMAVEGNFPTILSVILENGADPDLADWEGNNPLHLAMQLGHLSCVQVLLEDSGIQLMSTNMRGENCLHTLAKYAKESAGVIFSCLMASAAGFPINKQDGEGNTSLLLAYNVGSTALCDGLVTAGAHPGIYNKQGVGIFNAPVATKQLLFRVLDQINTEPMWLDGQFCQNCNMKFNISHRKHHCRHCGRLLCKQCTAYQIPILKFEITKPARVCEICADSFQLSSAR